MFDLSSRLLFPLDPAYTSFVPVSVAALMGLPGIPDPVLHYPTWPNSNRFVQPVVQFLVLIIRKNATGWIPFASKTFREISESDMEWAISAYAELYDTTLGHIGHSWFVMNTRIWTSGRINPLGKNIIFHLVLPTEICPLMSLKQLPSPWAFLIFDPDSGTFRSDIPILDYEIAPPSLRCYRFSSGLH